MCVFDRKLSKREKERDELPHIYTISKRFIKWIKCITLFYCKKVFYVVKLF